MKTRKLGKAIRSFSNGFGTYGYELWLWVIDLFYQHRVDPNVPIEDVAGTVKELLDCLL